MSSERKDLELSISFMTGDKVVLLIQKFMPCLTEAKIKDLSQLDSSVLAVQASTGYRYLHLWQRRPHSSGIFQDLEEGVVG